MADQQVPINFNLEPNKVPVLAMDGYLIASNEHAVTLSFAQATVDASQQNIVARIALSPAQAKDLVKNLNDHIEKFEV